MGFEKIKVANPMVEMDAGLVGLVVFQDVFLIGGAVYLRGSSLGWKVNTGLQLALVAAALLQPEFGTQETQSYITYLSWLVASTTVRSTAAYGAQYARILALISKLV